MRFKTVTLTDFTRLSGTATHKASLQQRLAAFSARPEVAGATFDVGLDARVVAARNQADAHPDCPFAKNLEASAIRDIVDASALSTPPSTSC